MPRGSRLPPGTAGTIVVNKLTSGRVRAHCRFRDLTGSVVQVERRGRSKVEAVNRLNEAIRDFSGGSGELGRSTTVNELLELFLSEQRADGRSPTTLRLYASYGNNHITPGMGRLTVGEVTPGRVDTLLRGLRKTKSAELVKGVRTVLVGLFALAVRHGAIEHNPVRETRPISMGSKPKPKFLDAAERVDLVSKLDAQEDGKPDRYKLDLPDICRFMLGTGMRIAEALAMDWSCIHLDVERPFVDQRGYNLVRVKGRGLVRQLDSTKARARQLPLPDFLLLVLQARRHGLMRQRQRQDASIESLPVFPAMRGANQGVAFRDPTNVGNAFRGALTEAGYPWVTSHVFRKTTATIFSESNLPDRDGATLIGHAREELYRNVYVGRAREIHPQAAGMLDRAMFAADEGTKEKNHGDDSGDL